MVVAVAVAVAAAAATAARFAVGRAAATHTAAVAAAITARGGSSSLCARQQQQRRRSWPGRAWQTMATSAATAAASAGFSSSGGQCVVGERRRIAVDLIPCRRDNYVFMFHDSEKKITAVVDPADAGPVRTALQKKGYAKLDYILNTHHHNDHTGGNMELKEHYNSVIIGLESDKHRIPGIDVCLKDKEKYTIGSLEFQCFSTPGHTMGHCVYWFPDTLFAMGCGRLFEGTAEDMFNSMSKLKKLPDTCKVYCAHEYTEANGKFAVTVEPENEDLQERLKNVIQTRGKGLPTVPSTIELEKLTNPFMRANSADHLRQIRIAKDRF